MSIEFYDIGSDSDTFYIIRSGQVRIETMFELESLSKVPLDH
jgi:hypothetical protein